MTRFSLSATGRTVLWIGGGALGGLAIGALVTNPDAAIALSPTWFLVTLIFVASVFAFLRAKPEAADAGAPEAAVAGAPGTGRAPPRQGTGLLVRVDLPSVPQGFPTVVGERESPQLVVSVRTPERAAAGAAIRVTSALRDGARALVGEGVTGGDGTVAFQLPGSGVGELQLEAEARLEGATGYATLAISVVRYEEEITRLFNEFRAFALGALGPDAASSTARELAERLRTGADATTSRALLEIARIYELVAYGEREADRRLYLALMAQLVVLERAELATDVPQEGAASRASPTLPEV